MNETASFGRLLAQGSTIDAMLELEQVESRSAQFEALDILVGRLIVQSLSGQRVIEIIEDPTNPQSITVSGLDEAQRVMVDTLFGLERQRGRGAWFLPDASMLNPGIVHLPFYFDVAPTLLGALVYDEHAKFSLNSTDAHLIWAVLEPLCRDLFQPFIQRMWMAGTQSPEEQLAADEESMALYKALGLSVADEVAPLKYRHGWTILTIGEQVDVMGHLISALREQITPKVAQRYRVYKMQSFIRHYYKKATNGRARRKQVLSKAFEQVLSGYFGGDWLAFLRYTGEQPHPDEQIVTVLPEVRLVTGKSNRAEQVAKDLGVPVEEVQRMVSTYWGQPGDVSPIEQRNNIIQRYWAALDKIHAQQEPGMPSLWGLVEDNSNIHFDYVEFVEYHRGVYRSLLPIGLADEIDHLWGSAMLSRWPNTIISEPFPHLIMAKALGPALRFWHGVSLTAWFVCEGPMSRTSIAGLAEYYKADLDALASLETPVNSKIFEELNQAETRLGPPQQVTWMWGGREMGVQRRAGFETLRDIITEHRRGWTEDFLKVYVQRRWELAVRDVGSKFYQVLHDGGKPPTLKRVAVIAEDVVNQWFGGDLSGLYGAIGERVPETITRRQLLPSDRLGFAKNVYRILGGETVVSPNYATMYQEFQSQNRPSSEWSKVFEEQQTAWRHQLDLNKQRNRLAQLSFWYVQLEEGLGRRPNLRDFGLSKFREPSQIIHQDLDNAWQIYADTIHAAMETAVDEATVSRKTDSYTQTSLF